MTKISEKTVYDFECVDLSGKPLSLEQFRGRPLVIVNTASLCGFTPQYEGLEKVWQRHKAEGLVVIGVPSNDFGKQEPGDSKAIITLCSTKFGISFPMLEKTPVKGSHAHPLFKWLASEGGFWSKPRWNFYKYIIGRDGHLKDWLSSSRKPESQQFEKAIKAVI